MALLIALGADDAGSGLFLPIALLYLTRVVGLPLTTASALLRPLARRLPAGADHANRQPTAG